MADDGSVIRRTVIEVLECNGSEVSPQPASLDMFLVVKEDYFEIIAIPEVCGRKLVRYLSRKFTTPIHHFYNPLMAPQRPGSSIH